MLLYRESTDTKVSSAGIEVRIGRKCWAQEAVDHAKARLSHSVLVGTMASGRAGIGCIQRTQYDKAQGKDRPQLVKEEIRAGVKERHICRMFGDVTTRGVDSIVTGDGPKDLVF